MADDKEQKKNEQAAENADKKATDAQKKADQKAAEKKVVATCSISIDDIFVQLHLKAAKAVPECKIQNSAIEGEGKSAKFHGAGSHIIAALPLKGDEISDVIAAECLKKYVSWFNGPDVANKITKDTIWALEDNNTADANKENADNKNESFVFIPSFNQFLAEEGEKTYKADLDAKATEKVKNKEQTFRSISNDNSKSKNVRQIADRGLAKIDAAKEKTAKGFYVTYKIAIEGQKESPLSDALKGFGAGLIKGLGIQGFSWKTGAKGKEHTIGDFLDSLDKVFGKIDPTELKTRFTKNAQAKYPQTRATDVSYYDQKTILQYLKDKLDTKQKQKVKTADYSLCYKVEANDKSKKLINTTVVADCITRSIKGLFKKFKNAVKPDDVILVNDYSESDKDDKKAEKKLEVNKNDAKSVTTDSLKIKVRGRLISEEGEEKQEKKIESTDKDKKQEKNLADMKAKLKELAEKTLGKDNFVSSDIWNADQLKEHVEQTDAPDLFSAVDGKKVQYAYVVQTKHTEQKEAKQEDKEEVKAVNSSLQTSVDVLLKKLFEANDKKKKEDDERTILNDLEDKVTRALKTLFDSFKQLLGKDDKLQDPKVYSIKVKEATKDKEDKEQVNSSLERDYSFVNKLFESDGFNGEIISLLLESGRHTAAHINELIDKIGSKEIQANKDKIIKTLQTDYSGKGKASEIRDELIGVKAKTKEKKWDAKQIKGWNKKHPDDKREEGYSEKVVVRQEKKGKIEEFFKLTNEDDMKKWIDSNFGSIQKTDDGEPLVQAFWKALSLLPEKAEDEKKEEKKETVKVNFYDADPETGEKKGDPLNKEPFEVEKGEKLKSVDDINAAVAEYNAKLEKNVADGYKYNGWKPAINDATADEDPTEVVADYEKEQEKDKTFTVQLMYAPDQEKPNATEVIKVDGEETQEVKAGEPAKMPEEMPEIEGYTFKDWGDDTEKLKKVEEPIVAVANYEKKIKIIPQAPKDPSKPDDELEPIGNPIEYDPEKPLEEQLPEAPEKEGWKAKGWSPDPAEVKDPKEDIKITATYEKVEAEKPADSKSEEIKTYWICPDLNGLLTPKDLSVKQNHTDVDFYIVPMKGLKFDNTDADDSNETASKGK